MSDSSHAGTARSQLERLATLVTLPFAFVGDLAWNLAWLAYIPISRLVRRRVAAEDLEG